MIGKDENGNKIVLGNCYKCHKQYEKEDYQQRYCKDCGVVKKLSHYD